MIWFCPERAGRKSGCGGILSIFFVREVVDWWRRLLLLQWLEAIMEGNAVVVVRVRHDDVAWERLLSGLRTCRVSIFGLIHFW